MNEAAVLTRLLFYTHHLPTISADSSYWFQKDLSSYARSGCRRNYFKRNDSQAWCPATRRKLYGRYQTSSE